MSTETDEIRDELRAVVRTVLAKAGPAAALERRVLAECGWLELEVPEALTGPGATFGETAVVLEELGRSAAATAYLGGVLGVGTLTLLAPGPQRDALLREVAASGALPVAALVDAEVDDLDADLPFRLERTTAGGWRVSGRAGFVPDAAGADRLLLLARDPRGVPVAVSLPPGGPGLRVAAQPVLDATRSLAVVRAEGAEVADDAVLRFGGDPRQAVARLRDRAALALACDSLGLSEAMLEATVAYAGTREQFGRPIGSFQAVKHACADMLVRVRVARQLVGEAVRYLADGHPDASARTSMAKSYACAAAVDVVGTAMQLHGGMGYTWESGIHVYLKRATLNRSLFGSPAAHRQRLAERY
jgi:alkylation response protein AidB-like acyl-CoA dehydrogenase